MILRYFAYFIGSGTMGSTMSAVSVMWLLAKIIIVDFGIKLALPPQNVHHQSTSDVDHGVNFKERQRMNAVFASNALNVHPRYLK